ncbi:MAG: alpha/beta fold hydrolase [Nocardioidaceae bacterium]
MESKPIVLVHGAWHGGWCWSRVVPLLQEKGHRVFAPSLTGLGDRRHLLTDSVSLQTHIDDIVNLIEFEELEDVVLCAHSAGGQVVAGVEQVLGDRIAHLIYLEAVIPAEGESLNDVLGDGDGLPDLFTQNANDEGDGWRVTPSAFTAEALGITDPTDAAWLLPKLTDHPFSAFTTPFHDKGLRARRHTFVRCQLFELGWPDRLLANAEADPHWETALLPTGHDAQVTMPREVADIIMG